MRLAELFDLRGGKRVKFHNSLNLTTCGSSPAPAADAEVCSSRKAAGRLNIRVCRSKSWTRSARADSFTAALVLGLLANWGADDAINQRANEVAAHVASCAGATPDLPDYLRASFTPTRGKNPNQAPPWG